MGLSGRIFGFGTLSMLVPQALMGVASVALVYGAVRRVSGYGAGLLAGAVLALTPVAALMFRFNNPDALLVLLLVVAGYCVTRALDGASTRWVALAGAAVGFAFLAKLLQALLITPALALVVLVAMPGSVRQRLRDLAVGVLAMLVSAGWYLALVSLWPKDSRPYIGGSTDNSLLQLALGYNGLGRVFGGDGNPGGGSGEGPGGYDGPMGGATDVRGCGGDHPDVRPVDGHGNLLAAACGDDRAVGRVVVHPPGGAHRPAPRSLAAVGWLARGHRAGVQLHEGDHASLLHGGAGSGHRRSDRHQCARAVARQAICRRPGGYLLPWCSVTGVWNFILLDRTPDWLPWLRWVVLVGSIVVAAVLPAGGHRLGRWTAALAVAGLLVGLGGTAAYTVETIAVGHSGPYPDLRPKPLRHGHGIRWPGRSRRYGSAASENTELKAILTQADNRWAAATVGSHDCEQPRTVHRHIDHVDRRVQWR